VKDDQVADGSIPDLDLVGVDEFVHKMKFGNIFGQMLALKDKWTPDLLTIHETAEQMAQERLRKAEEKRRHEEEERRRVAEEPRKKAEENRRMEEQRKMLKKGSTTGRRDPLMYDHLSEN
jgi:hypothetical protein